MYKTRKQIEQEIADRCAETHFDVLVMAELEMGDIKLARKLLNEASETYISQYDID
jgi:phosphoribosyl-ATP pyrophosphohydrolase